MLTSLSTTDQQQVIKTQHTIANGVEKKRQLLWSTATKDELVAKRKNAIREIFTNFLFHTDLIAYGSEVSLGVMSC